MNPLFKLSPLAFAITLSVLPNAQAADYNINSGQETWSSDRGIDGAISLRPSNGTPAGLTINNGAQVVSKGGRIGGSSTNSEANTAMATVVVEGAGTRWVVPRTNAVLDNAIVIGGAGQGTLNVLDGGQVSVRDLQLSDNGNAGNGLSRANLLVSGQNAKVDAVNVTSGGVFIYDSRINLQNGGQLASERVAIDSISTLTGAGTRWDNTGTFKNRNDLSLSDGAVLTSDSMELGAASIGRNTVVSVSGEGTRLATRTLTLGTTTRSTNMMLANGAELSSTDGIDISVLTSINSAARGALSIGGAVVRDDDRTDIDSITASAAQAAGRLDPQTAIRFGAGSGALAFNHTDSDLQLSNRISGAGRVYSFSGNTTLSGDLTGLSGSTVVRGGRLVLAGDVDQTNPRGTSLLSVGNGTLVVNGTVGHTDASGNYSNRAQVLDGGVLAGRGQVGSTQVASGGTLSPGEGALGNLSIKGDLDMAAGSRYAADIAGDGGSDQVNVSGTATLRGTRVDVTTLNEAQSYQNGQTYTLLTAQGGVVDGAAAGTAYAQAFSNSAFLDVSLQRTANALNLTIAQKTTTPPVEPPVQPPVEPPVEPPVQPPVEPPVEPPVQPPVEPPVEPPVQPPVEPPVEPPVQPPVEPPVQPPVQPPVEPPATGGTPGIFQTVALTENQWNTAGALSVLQQSGDPLRLYNNLLVLDAASARNAIDQLSGDYHSSTGTALIANSQVVSGVLGSRLRTLLDSNTVRMPLGASSFMPAAPDYQGGAWAQTFGNWSRLDGNNGSSGLRQRTGGVLIGADGSITQDWRAGVYGGYSRSKFDADDRDAKGNSDNYHLGLYTGAQLDALRLSADVGYTWHKLDSERNVGFAGFNDHLKGKRDANTLQASGEAAYRIGLGAVALEPFVGVSYVKYDADSFREKGGAAALDVSSEKQDTWFSTVGMRASTHTRVANRDTQVYGSLGWRRAYGDLDPRNEQSFAGGPDFEVQGIAQTRNVALTEVGAKMRLTRQTDLDLSYQGQFGSDTRFHSVNAGITVRF
ncbi:autotransporter domain-containing protein [Pseudomonas sp. K1(2024)]|uniref:Autotransporter domain-containing protein n=1 Tax=Pseudomonas boreofloridensis TaxID=3064348 RepID=A0ABV4Z589_9PSED|nr:autotransporter domain-containing protein [Pseudomonas sp. K13]MDO7902976.1 autotransporter domain-containing protein [Pseudomonas sp. K13]